MIADERLRGVKWIPKGIHFTFYRVFASYKVIKPNIIKMKADM